MITRGVPFTSFVYFLPVGTLAILFGGGGGGGDSVLFSYVLFLVFLSCFVLFKLCFAFIVFIMLLFCSA